MSPRRLVLLTSVAAVVGLAGGGAAWVLLHLISLLTDIAIFGHVGFHPPAFSEVHASPRLVIVAVIGAIIISLLAKWSPIIRGHGIPEAMEAILAKQSRVSPSTAVAKPVSAAVAIGTGAPFGAEGPIIVTGGAVGSLLGQVIRVSPAERKILLACGAAAGMSATFGAPLASVVLAIELLLFEFSARALVPLVVAASVAGAVHGGLYSPQPLFSVPIHEYAGLRAMPAFLLLGLACGLLAVVVSKGLFLVEGAYRRLPIGEFWHPVIGAVLFATIGMTAPRALGVGYDAIDDVLNQRLALGTVAVLGLVKLVIWWFALGSGTSGGTLAPILLISASFGTLLGDLVNKLPGPTIALGAFAVVAMAATFGAATRATFTAVVFVVELTRDYQVMLPLMGATVVADIVFNSLSEHSIMTEKLHRRGFRLGRHYGVDPFSTTPVKTIMTAEVATLPASTSVGEARRKFLSGGHGAYPVLDGGRMVGIATRGDVLRSDVADDVPLIAVASRDVVSVGPDDRAGAVLEVMLDEHIEHVPVLAGGQLVGICTRSDLLKVRAVQREYESPQPPHRPSALVRMLWSMPMTAGATQPSPTSPTGSGDGRQRRRRAGAPDDRPPRGSGRSTASPAANGSASRPPAEPGTTPGPGTDGSLDSPATRQQGH
jgi:H+/Cl- antiporter ClcA/CBS domain-containing protein